MVGSSIRTVLPMDAALMCPDSGAWTTAPRTRPKKEVPCLLPLQPGTIATVAQVSPVVGGLVRTWVDDEPVTWSVDDPAQLRSQLGRGQIARTQADDGRFREVASVSADGALLVHGRYRTAGRTTGAVYEVRRTARAPVEESHWAEFEAWLRDVTVAAASRGEFVISERGGWQHQPQPYAFFGCLRPEDEWLSYVEAASAPVRAGAPWPSPPRDPHGWILQAPAGPNTIVAAAIAMSRAVQEWATTPLELGVTFGAGPAGAFAVGEQTPFGTAEPRPGQAVVGGALAGRQAVSAVGEHVRALAERREVAVDLRGSYLSLRPGQGGRIAVYVHRNRVSVAVRPDEAEALATSLPGVRLERRSAATTYLIAAAQVLATAADAILALAVDAVDAAANA